MVTACPHCNAPQGSAPIQHGRIFCKACEAWYVAMRPTGGSTTLTMVRKQPPPPPRPMHLDTPTRELPEGMTRVGFKLIEYDDGTMFAVSSIWGCSKRSTDLAEVIDSARQMYRFCQFVNRKKEEEQQP